jgi:hypothetical protein
VCLREREREREREFTGNSSPYGWVCVSLQAREGERMFSLARAHTHTHTHAHTHTHNAPLPITMDFLSVSFLAGKVAESCHCEEKNSFCYFFFNFSLEKCCFPKAIFLSHSLCLSLSLSPSLSLCLSLSPSGLLSPFALYFSLSLSQSIWPHLASVVATHSNSPTSLQAPWQVLSRTR